MIERSSAWSGLLLALLVAGCGSFTAGVEEPDLAAQSSAVAAQIRVGESTRAEVRALLGHPAFASDAWGVELFQIEQKDLSTEWIVVLLVPVPGWTQVRDYRLYPLVAYGTSGRVEGFDVGRYAEHPGYNGTFKDATSLSATALGFTFVVEPCPQPGCLWLLAPADPGAAVLRAAPGADTCVLVVARPPGGLQVEVDDERLLETVMHRDGLQPLPGSGSWYARRVVGPGQHEVWVTPAGSATGARVSGALHWTVDCRGHGYFVIRARRHATDPARSFGPALRGSEIEVFDSPAALEEDARLILFHGGRSLVPES